MFGWVWTGRGVEEVGMNTFQTFPFLDLGREKLLKNMLFPEILTLEGGKEIIKKEVVLSK